MNSNMLLLSLLYLLIGVGLLFVYAFLFAVVWNRIAVPKMLKGKEISLFEALGVVIVMNMVFAPSIYVLYK